MKSAQGMKSINTPVKSQIHAIPNPLRATYLDLFMLQKERENLEKECQRITGILKNNKKRLSEIKEQMAELLETQDISLRKSSLSGTRVFSSSQDKRTEWKTMKLGY